MGVLKSLKAMREAMAAGLAGGQPSAEALASLSPEQRAAYEAQLAAAADRQQEVVVEAAEREERRPLHGPAGEWRYGSGLTGQVTSEQLASMSGAEQIEYSIAMSKAQLSDVWRNPLGRADPAPLPPPIPGASPDRGQQAAAERALRDAARAPYRAPVTGPITFTRLVTRGGDQIEDVAAHLGTSGLVNRPDLVFGTYRVPDAIGIGGLGGGRSKVVEWEVVHGATEALPAAPPPTAVHFDGEEHWVGRSIGQPTLLDEELAITYLGAAGMGPERSLGIARLLEIQQKGGGDTANATTVSRVTGVEVFHPASAAGAGVYQQMAETRPLAIAESGPPGVWIEVLNWSAVASVIHPDRHKPALIPSPFRYLPSTPQELLQAYLEVVGLHPAHCYSVQVTEDDPSGLDGTGRKAGFSFTTNVGEEQPCADGTLRRRLRGGSVVVIAYLDTAEYVDGRRRWDAYQREVLQARLHQGTGARRAVEAPAFERLPGGIRTLAKIVDSVDRVVDNEGDPFEGIAPHRYCWPPLDAR